MAPDDWFQALRILSSERIAQLGRTANCSSLEEWRAETIALILAVSDHFEILCDTTPGLHEKCFYSSLSAILAGIGSFATEDRTLEQARRDNEALLERRVVQ